MTIREHASQEVATREYTFTVVFEPLGAGANGKKGRPGKNLPESGYQVTVPILPGLITFGRTRGEARQMARDAIRCHLEGLRKDGEPIPAEKSIPKHKLHGAFTP
jgi:predicted RNase H-like HicB family nuclease